MRGSMRSRGQGPGDTWVTGNFQVEQITRLDYRLYPSASNTNNTFLLTGSDATFTFTLPFPFVPQWMLYYHMDSSYVDSDDALDITIQRAQNSVPGNFYLGDKIFAENDIVSVDGRINLSEPRIVVEPGQIEVVLDSTNTDRLAVELYVTREEF